MYTVRQRTCIQYFPADLSKLEIQVSSLIAHCDIDEQYKQHIALQRLYFRTPRTLKKVYAHSTVLYTTTTTCTMTKDPHAHCSFSYDRARDIHDAHVRSSSSSSDESLVWPCCPCRPALRSGCSTDRPMSRAATCLSVSASVSTSLPLELSLSLSLPVGEWSEQEVVGKGGYVNTHTWRV